MANMQGKLLGRGCKLHLYPKFCNHVNLFVSLKIIFLLLHLIGWIQTRSVKTQNFSINYFNLQKECLIILYHLGMYVHESFYRLLSFPVKIVLMKIIFQWYLARRSSCARPKFAKKRGGPAGLTNIVGGTCSSSTQLDKQRRNCESAAEKSTIKRSNYGC